MPLLISVSVGLALLRTEGGKQTFVTQTLATHLDSSEVTHEPLDALIQPKT